MLQHFQQKEKQKKVLFAELKDANEQFSFDFVELKNVNQIFFLNLFYIIIIIEKQVI